MTDDGIDLVVGDGQGTVAAWSYDGSVLSFEQPDGRSIFIKFATLTSQVRFAIDTVRTVADTTQLAIEKMTMTTGDNK